MGASLLTIPLLVLAYQAQAQLVDALDNIPTTNLATGTTLTAHGPQSAINYNSNSSPKVGGSRVGSSFSFSSSSSGGNTVIAVDNGDGRGATTVTGDGVGFAGGLDYLMNGEGFYLDDAELEDAELEEVEGVVEEVEGVKDVVDIEDIEGIEQVEDVEETDNVEGLGELEELEVVEEEVEEEAGQQIIPVRKSKQMVADYMAVNSVTDPNAVLMDNVTSTSNVTNGTIGAGSMPPVYEGSGSKKHVFRAAAGIILVAAWMCMQ
ncbi:hypothetical protein BZA77DRAFT_315146 [Pyronema omphalodes]|nr:hypothetical protein BZA77DRAFT_315146 [Pyronema omphalodes]